MRVPLYRHNLHGCNPDDLANEFKKIISGMHITTGPIAGEMQKLFADYMRIDHCVLTNNWTNAAIATLMAMGIKNGDEVIIPALTFAGTANAIIAVGARPVLVDIDPNTKLMDLNRIKDAINFRTKVVMPVHLYGQMVDIEALRDAIGSRIDIMHIVEDAAHAIESELNGSKPGAHSSAALFSFYASKSITTGEGGAMVTNDSDLLAKFNLKYRHGIDLSGYNRHIGEGFKESLMVDCGIKANMPDTQAFLMRPQLERIQETHAARTRLALRYLEQLSDLAIDFPTLVPNSVHAWHLFTIGVDADRREKILHELDARGIKTTMHYRSLNDMPYMQEKFGFSANSFPHATLWGRRTISLPLFADLKDEEQDYVIKTLREII